MLSPDPERRAARLLSAAELGYELGRFAQVEQITAEVARMALPTRERSRLTWLEGAFHDGVTSEPADIRHLVGLARRAVSDDDADLAMQLLFGAARRVWWRDPGEGVRDDVVRAAREVALPAGDPRLLAVLGLSESLTLAPTIVAQLDSWPADAGGRPDLAALLGVAAFPGPRNSVSSPTRATSSSSSTTSRRRTAPGRSSTRPSSASGGSTCS